MAQQPNPNGDKLGRITSAIRKVLYQQPTSDQVEGMLLSHKNAPADALAMAAGLISKLLMKESNGAIPQELSMPMMITLINELSDMAAAIGMKIADQDKQKAMQLLVQAGQYMAQNAQRAAASPPQQAQPAGPVAPAPQPQQPPPMRPGIIGSRVAA